VKYPLGNETPPPFSITFVHESCCGYIGTLNYVSDVVSTSTTSPGEVGQDADCVHDIATLQHNHVKNAWKVPPGLVSRLFFDVDSDLPHGMFTGRVGELLFSTRLWSRVVLSLGATTLQSLHSHGQPRPIHRLNIFFSSLGLMHASGCMHS
jgi:hypothetical protein